MDGPCRVLCWSGAAVYAEKARGCKERTELGCNNIPSNCSSSTLWGWWVALINWLCNSNLGNRLPAGGR